MNKAQALHSFWSSFGLLAIDEQSLYDRKDLPPNYISYEVQTGSIGEPVALTASLWYRSTSWENISEKADQIAQYIGYGGKVMPVEDGYIWIKLGNPFAQRMLAEQDNTRRMILNISVDYLTAT